MQPEQPDYDQPVAYDKDGNPLYAHPAVAVETPQSSPVPPQTAVVSEEVAKRHQESVARYPNLNLTANEYVIIEVEKHWIGTIVPIAIGTILALLVCFGLLFFPVLVPQSTVPLASLIAPAMLLLILIIIGTYIPVWVYKNNRFYLTNESAIQDVQTSLFARQEQTVSLGSVEDVSFHQTGVIQLLLNYGTVRLSTIGDEDTYTFTNVAQPKEKTTLLNNAVEAFKNGRPVDNN